MKYKILLSLGFLLFLLSSSIAFVGTTGKTLNYVFINKNDWAEGHITYVPLNGSIQSYVNSAAAGDTLILASGTYNITSTITINKQLNIVGQGNSGLVTLPITPKHGTLIKSATSGVVAFQIDANNVRVASLSIYLTGAGSTGVNTANNLSGIVLTNIDVIITATGWTQGFTIYGSNAILRDLTFYITSTTTASSGVWLWNDATTTQNAVVDCFNVTGTVVGAGSFAYAFVAENDNATKTVTLNLQNSLCRALSGTLKDIAVASISTTPATNNSIVNAYLSTFDGNDFDAYQDNLNQLNLGGSVIVNNKIFGIVTYRAAIAAGLGVFGNGLTKTMVVRNGADDGYCTIDVNSGIITASTC